VRYGSERKEREIQRQRADLAALNARSERRKFWLALLGGVAGAVVLVSLLLLQVQRRRARETRDAAVIAERERGLRHLVESTETERQRIAAELHDGVGQQISGLRFRLEDAASRDASLSDLLAIADDASKEVRGLAHQMMPRALASQGVVPAIEDMLQKTLSRPDMRYSFEPYGLGERLPQPIETGAYRIAQELVNNVIKHAAASEVHVQLLRNKGYLVLMVEDNGRGISSGPRGSGFGMQGMYDRARLLHGTLTFEAGPERGTIATLRVPLDTMNQA
jgi:signal transduction histidine kinase